MTAIQFVDESPSVLNGAQGPFIVESPLKRSANEAGLDSDSDSDEEVHVDQHGANPKPGKKTKGRVKIKMEFIENKLRRYTTFSKRKTGIMKKAYELSTLTGTQVMLLVASETGHVYTFATRKLQPMITSESGKALIQTCLNSPDAPTSNSASTIEDTQRMNPTGYEEPELSYGISEDEQPKGSDSPSMTQLYNNTMESSPSPQHLLQTHINNSSSDLIRQRRSPTPNPPPAHNNSSSSISPFMSASNLPGSANNNKPPMVMSSSTPNPVTGTPVILSTAGYASGTVLSNSQSQPTLYRLPTAIPGQVVNLPVPTQVQSVPKAENSESSSMLNTSKKGGTNATAGGTIMYQTPQGVVYASAPSASVPGLPEGYILNLPQNSAIQTMQDQQQPSGAQQYITIPVPVSLAASDAAQVLQPVIAQAATSSNSSLIQQLSKPK